jgi:transposase
MPKDMPDGAFGPQLQARIGLLSGRYRLPRRETRALAKDLFGVRISLGSVQACCKSVSGAVVATAEIIHAGVKQARVNRLWPLRQRPDVALGRRD